MASASSDTTKAGLPRSRPIAIEIPVSRRLRPGDPPSAPLSARGDLPGGYFPEHEDPNTRIHRPHPFHADATEARRRSIARANEECLSPQNDADHGKNGGLVQTGGAGFEHDLTVGPGSKLDLTGHLPAGKPSVTETAVIKASLERAEAEAAALKLQEAEAEAAVLKASLERAQAEAAMLKARLEKAEAKAAAAKAETSAPGRHGSAKDTELPSAAGSSSKPPAVHAAYSYTVDESAPTSITSYNPTGAEDNALPMGKYYPTNWENRKRAKREKKQREREASLLREQQTESQETESQGRSSGCHSSQLDGPVPLLEEGPIASTSASEAAGAPEPTSESASASASGKAKRASGSKFGKTKKPSRSKGKNRAAAPPSPYARHEEAEAAAAEDRDRRLLQYQRDMVTQTALAASGALGSQIKKRGPQEVLQSLAAIPAFQGMQLNQSPGSKSGEGQAVPSLSVSESTISSASPGSILHGRGLAAVLAAADQLGILTGPRSPRLEPLGSPGPVTPIDLSHTEEAANNAGGLLAAGRPKMPVAVASAPPAAGRPKVPAVLATTAPWGGPGIPCHCGQHIPSDYPLPPSHHGETSFPFELSEH